MASHQISTIFASNGQSKQSISQNNHFSLFPRKRTFNLHPLLAPSSSVSTSSISTVASTSSQPISVSVSFGSKSMKHRGDRSGKSNISTQEMEELEWNFPLFEGLERGSGGSSNLISDERTSTTETHLELKEEFDMDLFGQPNLVAAATINNGQSTNFDIKSILDPILFQQPSNDQPSEPAFDFSYTTQNNDVDLFTNHHLSLGVAHPISVITESPIIFNNSYDVSGHSNHVSLPSSTSVEPSSSVSFINPQDLHNTSPIISSPNHDFLAGSPMSLNGDSMPVLPELVSPMISESGDKSEDEDGMPPTPDIMNGVALPSFGFGTPLLGDDLIPDQLRELGLFTGAFGGFIPSVGPSNFSNGVQGGTGVSPLLDPSRPGMKELLKMFPGLTNLDNDILEKILTPPTSNSTPSQPQLNSSIMSPVSSQLREPTVVNEERVPSSSLKSPILEGEMSVRNEIAKRRRNPAIMMKREGTASSVVEISKEEMDIRRRSSCTNQHRRLIDLDAPTQPRNYVSPSTTSRKPSHTTVSKRKGAVLPDGTAAIEDEGRVEKKRRQNTLSARRSRARRAEIIGTLEDRKRCLEDELERYKLRVEEAERFIRGFGRV